MNAVRFEEAIESWKQPTPCTHKGADFESCVCQCDCCGLVDCVCCSACGRPYCEDCPAEAGHNQ